MQLYSRRRTEGWRLRQRSRRENVVARYPCADQGSAGGGGGGGGPGIVLYILYLPDPLLASAPGTGERRCRLTRSSNCMPHIGCPVGSRVIRHEARRRQSARGPVGVVWGVSGMKSVGNGRSSAVVKHKLAECITDYEHIDEMGRTVDITESSSSSTRICVRQDLDEVLEGSVGSA